MSGVERNQALLDKVRGSLDRRNPATDWPWHEFNKLFTRIVRGQLVVIGSRPANGKTTLAMNLLAHLDELGQRVLVFGTEMVPENLVKRWAAAELGITERHVFEDFLDDYQREALAKKSAALLGSGRINFVDATSLDLDRIYEEMLLAAQEGRAPDVIIVDHLHRMSQEWSDLNEIAQELQEAAVKANMTVILFAQLNRAEHRRNLDQYLPPSQDRYKGAAAIEENADLALGLYRPLIPMDAGTLKRINAGEEPIENHAEPNTMGVICTKSRYNGSALGKVVRLRLQGSQLRSYGIVRTPREDVEL